MGIFHLISALVSFFRWLERQQREAAVRAGRTPPPLSHSPGEAARVHPAPAQIRPANLTQPASVARPVPMARPANVNPAANVNRPANPPARVQPAHRPPARHQSIIDDAPHGPVEWIMRRFEGAKD